jgi:seryl-tRNA synthetase
MPRADRIRYNTPMLDIQFIRENPDEVADKSKQKGYDVDVKELLKLDEDRRKLLQQVEDLRRQRNDLASRTKGAKPSDEQIKKGKELKEKTAGLEQKLNPIGKKFLAMLKTVPNMPLQEVPIGKSEHENRIAYKKGEPNKFDFKPRTHWEIAKSKDWIDKERAAKVSGSRFAYIKGDLVKLQFALIQFTIDTLTDQKKLEEIITSNNLKTSSKPFTPVLPPYMIRTEVFDAMDRLEPKDDRYKIEEDDLWLQGSAEHVLGSMHMREDIPYDELPLRYLGYATSFRREAGNYGKDTEGIFRMHQFDKLEMESITDEKSGLEEHKLLIAIQEYLMQQLGIPYQVIEKCTADIGKPNARGIDIDAWLPGQGKYRETHTADYMTDYQARRLNMLYRRFVAAPETDKLQTETVSSAGSKTFLVHTNDATAFAMGRTLIAIIENFQTKDGKVRVPKALQPFMSGQTEI